MNKYEYDISVVIVSWNAKRFLRECLVALDTAVKNLNCEIIVVDNASEDGSWEMVREEFPEVNLLRNETNIGFARATNRGIEASKGRYICLLNSDVLVFKESIKLLYEYMETHPDIGILGPRVLNTDLSVQPSCRTFPTLRSSLFRALKLDTSFPRSRFFGEHYMTYWDFGDTREVDILSGCCLIIRRIALQDIGLLDPLFFIYGEDMDICRRFHVAGWKVVFYHRAQIIHHRGASSANQPDRFWIEMQRANLQYWLKYNSVTSTFAYYCCLILHNVVRVISFGAKAILMIYDKKNNWIKFGIYWRGLVWLLLPSTIHRLLRRTL